MRASRPTVLFTVLSCIVHVTGVPGMVRSAYEQSELDIGDAVLLDVGESPEEKAAAARFLMPLSAVLIALGGALTFLRLR